MTDSTLAWIVMALLLAFGIHTLTIYTLVRFLTTGRRLFAPQSWRDEREAPRTFGGGFDHR
jgi:hypothetical protein